MIWLFLFAINLNAAQAEPQMIRCQFEDKVVEVNGKGEAQLNHESLTFNLKKIKDNSKFPHPHIALYFDTNTNDAHEKNWEIEKMELMVSKREKNLAKIVFKKKDTYLCKVTNLDVFVLKQLIRKHNKNLSSSL